MSLLFPRMAIAGVGLIGGSLAAAARAAGLVGEVVGCGRSAANLRLARERGLIDRIAHAPEEVGVVDAVVLAVPVGVSGPLAARFRPHVPPGTLLTDVGSVKRTVVEALEHAWAGLGPVVGAHPIAGSEASGAAAADAALFRGHRCIVTPTPATDRSALARVRALWEGVGMTVEEMDPGTHDAILARVSHAPHLVAYALVSALDRARADGRPVLPYAGSGLRDTTRIAASRADVWRDIALANAPAVRAALAEFRTALDALEALIATGDGGAIEATLTAACAVRRRLGGVE